MPTITTNANASSNEQQHNDDQLHLRHPVNDVAGWEWQARSRTPLDRTDPVTNAVRRTSSPSVQVRASDAADTPPLLLHQRHLRWRSASMERSYSTGSLPFRNLATPAASASLPHSAAPATATPTPAAQHLLLLQQRDQATASAPEFTMTSARSLHADDPDATPFWGWVLLTTTYLCFVGGMYSIFIAKWMPTTSSWILDWIREDQYYCLLVPLSLPLFVYAIAWNWLGMKLFRHN